MKRVAYLVLGWLAWASAIAAPFADPTQPPGGGTVLDGTRGGAVDGPRLQSVLIAPNRRLAVIDGRTISLGGMFGSAKVVRITESEVVLQTGADRQTLKLHPEIEKRGVRPVVRTAVGQKGARQ
jgi:MSHA biogenesis protein MshK